MGKQLVSAATSGAWHWRNADGSHLTTRWENLGAFFVILYRPGRGGVLFAGYVDHRGPHKAGGPMSCEEFSRQLETGGWSYDGPAS